MIPTNGSEAGAELVQTGRDGRIRYSPEQREKLLDLFEGSGMTGKAFCEEYGLKYPTFSTWRRARREHGAGEGSGAGSEEAFILAEVGAEPGTGLVLKLPGGAAVHAQGKDGAAQLADLIKRLR